VINRPKALNSMTQPMYGDLSKAWIEVRDNPEIWVAVVTGAPHADRPPERQGNAVVHHGKVMEVAMERAQELALVKHRDGAIYVFIAAS
jgi:1,4-dihydroxy-2-naphthoyl-CoA synthase